MIQTDVYKMASRFLGVREVAGAVHNAQILAMLRLDNIWPEGDEVPWCSAFVNYVAWLLDVPRSKSLAARSWLNVGEHVETVDAVRGMDIVVLTRDGAGPNAGHVGVFDRLDGIGIYVLGGNQGNAVSIARFPVTQVLGVRRLVPRVLSNTVGE